MLISPLSSSITLLDKILVTFIQVLNKVATLYPFELPSVFYSTWTWINARNPFVLDLNVLPFNCIVETNFHSRLGLGLGLGLGLKGKGNRVRVVGLGL
jgi:hypothetical protein